MTVPPAPRGNRLHRPDLRVEKQLLRGGCTRLAAMDEVGRGALAGPVTVGVVVVTATIGRVPAGLRDSKLLTPAARERLVAPVRRWAIEWAVGHAWPEEIDRDGIMTGLRLAAWRALAQLAGPVDAVLLDGNYDYLNASAEPALFPEGWRMPVTDPPSIPVHLRIKADLRCAGVAAASVLAKTTRDAMMTEYAGAFPVYGWDENKGYATPEHRAAIAEHGPCERHRRSWHLSGTLTDLETGPRDGAAMGNDEGVVERDAAALPQQPTMDVKGA